MTSPAVQITSNPQTDITRQANHEILAEAQRKNASVQIHFISPNGDAMCTSGPVVRLSEFAVWVRDDRFTQSLHGALSETPDAFPAGYAYGVYLRSIEEIKVLNRD